MSKGLTCVTEAKHTESKNKGHVYFSRYYHFTIEKFKTHDQTINSYSFQMLVQVFNRYVLRRELYKTCTINVNECEFK